MMLSDFDVNNPIHRKALIGYLQMAVDLRSMASNGVTWLPDGGHSSGRKLPLIFAGWFLNDPSFAAAVGKSSFAEDKQVYYSAKANMALFGRDCGTDKAYWSDTMGLGGTKDCRDPYGMIDGGGRLVGGDGYDYCCNTKPWKYTALAVRMLGLESTWNYPPFFQYVDRWVKQGTWTANDNCAAYTGSAADYALKFGATGVTTDCIKGSGRWPAKNGLNKDGGLYSRLLGDQMWTSWAAAHP
jgi:hypothetical protein